MASWGAKAVEGAFIQTGEFGPVTAKVPRPKGMIPMIDKFMPVQHVLNLFDC
jgi:hypothetical protein